MVTLEDVLNQVDNSVTVAVLVIIPGNKFDEVIVERDSSSGIEDTAEVASIEV